MSQQAPPPIPQLPPLPPTVQVLLPRQKGRGKSLLILILLVLLAVSVVVNINFLAMAAVQFEGLSHKVIQEGQPDQTVALYRVSGLIAQEAAEGFERFARQVRDDQAIKAVVLRIDSGGGSVSASDQIHRQVLAIQQQRQVPVVVSMGGVAASGGYYISAPADMIYAEPTTVTGSIGVIAVWPVVAGMLDKIGVEVVTIRSTDARVWKARENFWEAPDQRVRQNVQDMLDKMQERFEQVVRDGRGNKLVEREQTFEITDRQGQPQSVQVTVPFDGQVYVGSQAAELGLVDRIGYLDEAWGAAAELASLSKPRVVEYSRHKPLFEQLVAGKSGVNLDPRHLAELSSPQVLMLWRP